MADELEQSTRRAAQRSAERLGDLLDATAGELARRTDPVPVTAAEPDVVDLLGNLARLRQVSVRLQQDLTSGVEITEDRWEQLAQVFDQAAAHCRERLGEIVVPGEVAEPEEPG